MFSKLIKGIVGQLGFGSIKDNTDNLNSEDPSKDDKESEFEQQASQTVPLDKLSLLKKKFEEKQNQSQSPLNRNGKLPVAQSVGKNLIQMKSQRTISLQKEKLLNLKRTSLLNTNMSQKEKVLNTIRPIRSKQASVISNFSIMEGADSESNPRSSGIAKRNSMYLEKCKSPKVACVKTTQPGRQSAQTEFQHTNQETAINFQTNQDDCELGELPNELNIVVEDNILNFQKHNPKMAQKMTQSRQILRSIASGSHSSYAPFTTGKAIGKTSGHFEVHESCKKFCSPQENQNKKLQHTDSYLKNFETFSDIFQSKQNILPYDSSDKITTNTTPVKYEYNLAKNSAIKEVSKFEEESPDVTQSKRSSGFIKNTYDLNQFSLSPQKIQNSLLQNAQLTSFQDGQTNFKGKESNVFSKTFDKRDKTVDQVLYPSQRSAFSFAPKYYKPSCSLSVNSKNNQGVSESSKSNGSKNMSPKKDNFLDRVILANQLQRQQSFQTSEVTVTQAIKKQFSEVVNTDSILISTSALQTPRQLEMTAINNSICRESLEKKRSEATSSRASVISRGKLTQDTSKRTSFIQNQALLNSTQKR